uniref:DnaJ homolog subfamily B member 9 n=1 Tax=Tetranychus urticae TaxID=32264 RepID=T1L6M6_TETUR
MDVDLNICYRVLSLHYNATASEVKKAYKRMALRYHPDKNKSPGAKDKFQAINNAYTKIMAAAYAIYESQQNKKQKITK